MNRSNVAELGSPAILTSESRGLSHQCCREIEHRFREGTHPHRLAEEYERPVTTIRRVIRMVQAIRLREVVIEYIPNDDFASHTEDPQSPFLDDGPPVVPNASVRLPKYLPAYLACLYDVPLLTPERERHLFRKMNYLGYLAKCRQESLEPTRPDRKILDELERFLTEMAQVRNEIISANLRLVLPIAKRYMRPGWDFFELVSEGNMSLIRAVEKFDFARGYRFSTYAVWTIIKNYTRSMTNESRYHGRFCTGFEDHLSTIMQELTDPEEQERQAVRNGELVRTMLGILDPREYEVIVHRFGLSPERESLTLRQIGLRIGVSKERVRQIEARALDKLRSNGNVGVGTLSHSHRYHDVVE